ncbi:MAG: hypothetical protein OSJ74_11785, partial [Clostridia bacterium]|nr:hypothetical protein [Clostridia bacterium]
MKCRTTSAPSCKANITHVSELHRWSLRRWRSQRQRIITQGENTMQLKETDFGSNRYRRITVVSNTESGLFAV